MEIDLSITITAIIAVVALVTPLITTHLNNNHQLELRKLELNEDNKKLSNLHKKEIFEEFLKSAGRYISNPSSEHTKLFSEQCLVISLYLPDDLSSDVLDIYKDRYNNNGLNNINDKIIEITPKIKQILNSL